MRKKGEYRTGAGPTKSLFKTIGRTLKKTIGRRDSISSAKGRGGRTFASFEKQKGKVMTPQWKETISLYDRSELRGLNFVSRDDSFEGIRLLMKDPFFRNMPFGAAGEWTFVVPLEAVSYLTEHDVQCTVDMLSNDDPLPDDGSVGVMHWTQVRDNERAAN